MELIIAVVLLAVFFILRSSETSKSASTDRVLGDAQLQKDEWIGRVVDQELTDRLEDDIQCAWDAYFHNEYMAHNHEMPDSARHILEEVNAAHREMGWDEIPEKYYYRYLLKDNRNHTLRILLANRGKLTWADAYFGLKVDNNSQPTRLRRREQLQHDRQLVRYIDGKLREHGICENLYFTGPMGDGKPVPFGEEDPDLYGHYEWAPMISPWKFDK